MTVERFRKRTKEPLSRGTVERLERATARMIRADPRELLRSPKLIWTLVAIAILFRVAQYASNPSIWMDEAFLELNVDHKPASDLLEPLNNRQSAPLGFLLAQKGIVEVLGTSEYALRLLPFACAVASVFIFYAVARRWLDSEGLPVALVLFATTTPLIIYAVQAKQYSGDVAAASAVYLGAIWMHRWPTSALQAAAFGSLAALAVLLSHPAAFVVAAVLITGAFTVNLRRGVRPFAVVTLAASIALAAFVVSYIAVRDQIADVQQALDSGPALGATVAATGDAMAPDRELSVFMPFPPSQSTLKWAGDQSAAITHDSLGSHRVLTGALAIVLIVGGVSLFRRARTATLMLTLPIPLVLIASAMELYPVGGRFLLFLVPALLLILAEGTVAVLREIRGPAALVGILLAAVVLLAPAISAASNVLDPWSRQEMKPLLEHLNDSAREGDGLYVYYASQYAFRYYSERGVLKGSDGKLPWKIIPSPGGTSQFAPTLRSAPPLVVGEYDPAFKRYTAEFQALRGNDRVWVIAPQEEDRLLLRHLDAIGTRRVEVDQKGVSLFLYDLS